MPKKKIPKLIKVAIYLIVLLMICWGILMSLIFSGNFSPNAYERSEVHLLSFSPDSSKLISCDYEDTIQIWDIGIGKELYQFSWTKTASITTRPTDIKWLQDGERFAVMDGLNIRIYDVSTHDKLWNDSVSSYLDVSENGRYFASTAGIWDAVTYIKKSKLNISCTSHFVDLSSSGDELTYLPLKNAPEIINTSDGKTIHTLEEIGRNLTDMRFYYKLGWSADENKIALLADYKKGDEGIFLYIWETINYSLLFNKTFPLRGGYADLSPDCTKFIYGNLGEGNVTVFDAISGESSFALKVSDNGVSSVDWSPDGNLIAAGSNDGIIKIWDATTGELIQTMMTPKDHRVPT